MDTCFPRSELSNTSKAFLSGLDSLKQSYAPLHGWICFSICVFGVVTNFIHILVLTSKNMRHSAVNVVLTAIAFCDAGTMLSYLIYLWHFVLSPSDFETRYCRDEGAFMSLGWMVFLMMHITVSIALHTSSLWLAVLMAFIRLMTLRQGALSSRWQKSGNAWALSLTIYVVVIALCVPTIICHEIKEFNRHWWYPTCRGPNMTMSEYLNDTSYAVYTIDTSTLAISHDCLLYKANLWLTGIMFKFVPCVFLVLLSSSLLTRISAAEKNRRRLLGVTKDSTATRRRSMDNTTLMLIAILLLFLITELPQGTIAIMHAGFLSQFTTLLYQHLADFLDLLSLINSSVNFILYCVMSSRYRQTFWKVLCPAKLSALVTTKKRLTEWLSNWPATYRTSPPNSAGIVSDPTLRPGTILDSGQELELLPRRLEVRAKSEGRLRGLSGAKKRSCSLTQSPISLSSDGPLTRLLRSPRITRFKRTTALIIGAQVMFVKSNLPWVRRAEVGSETGNGTVVEEAASPSSHLSDEEEIILV